MKIDVVPYSESFVKRTVCKFCNTGPTIRYVSYETFCERDYGKLKNVIYKYYSGNDSFRSGHVYLVNLRDDLDMNYYSFVPPFSFNVRLHKNMKYPSRVDHIFEMIDIVVCECNKTAWFFNISYPEKINKVDVFCRKSYKKHRIDF